MVELIGSLYYFNPTAGVLVIKMAVQSNIASVVPDVIDYSEGSEVVGSIGDL